MSRIKRDCRAAQKRFMKWLDTNWSHLIELALPMEPDHSVSLYINCLCWYLLVYKTLGGCNPCRKLIYHAIDWMDQVVSGFSFTELSYHTVNVNSVLNVKFVFVFIFSIRSLMSLIYMNLYSHHVHRFIHLNFSRAKTLYFILFLNFGHLIEISVILYYYLFITVDFSLFLLLLIWLWRYLVTDGLGAG